MDGQEYLEILDSNMTDNGDLDDLFEFLRRDNLPQLISLTAVLGVLCIIGSVGNVIVIAVFCRSLIRQTSAHLITALAITDLIILTVAIPGVLVKNWSYPFYIDAVCKAWEFVRMTTVPMSALNLMVIAFDRYFLICAKCYRDKSKMFLRASTVSIITCSTGLGIPPMLAVGVYQRDSDGRMQYLGLCMPNFLTITPMALENYWRLVTALMVAILLTVITLYSMVFIKVYKQSHKWNSFRQAKIQPVTGNEKNVKTMQDLNINHQTCKEVPEFANENSKENKVFKIQKENDQQGPRETSTKSHFHDQEVFLIKVDPWKINSLANTEKPSFKSLYQITANANSVFQDEVNSNKLHHDRGNPESQYQSETKAKSLHQTEDDLKYKNPDQVMFSHRRQAYSSVYPTPTLTGKLNMISEDNANASTSNSLENSQSRNSEKQESENNPQRQNIHRTEQNNRADTVHQVMRHQPGKLGQHRAHIKTAKVLLVVTIVYFVSYCPTFLMSCDVISDQNLFLFYSYFLHSAANPIIYSFMNKQFRQAVTKLLLGCKSNATNLK